MSYLVTRGMGDAIGASRTIGQVGSVGAGAATAILGTIAAHGGTVLGLTGTALSAAVPIIGAGLAAATLLVQYLVANSGCGQTCIVTSQWANQAADALQQVMDGYFALPAPRTDSQKALAIANFQTIWQQLTKACGDPQWGDAGRRCISDRQAGACTWRQKYAPTYPGQPNVGECWNWFNGYLKPIQDDVTVSDSVATSVSQDLQAVFGPAAGGPSLLPLAVFGGLVALGVWL